MPVVSNSHPLGSLPALWQALVDSCLLMPDGSLGGREMTLLSVKVLCPASGAPYGWSVPSHF